MSPVLGICSLNQIALIEWWLDALMSEPQQPTLRPSNAPMTSQSAFHPVPSRPSCRVTWTPHKQLSPSGRNRSPFNPSSLLCAGWSGAGPRHRPRVHRGQHAGVAGCSLWLQHPNALSLSRDALYQHGKQTSGDPLRRTGRPLQAS